MFTLHRAARLMHDLLHNGCVFRMHYFQTSRHEQLFFLTLLGTLIRYCLSQSSALSLQRYLKFFALLGCLEKCSAYLMMQLEQFLQTSLLHLFHASVRCSLSHSSICHFQVAFAFSLISVPFAAS